MVSGILDDHLASSTYLWKVTKKYAESKSVTLTLPHEVRWPSGRN